jgi:hypothetical protein
LDFPGQEKIKFGDIVQAPPKLSYIPKVSTWNSQLYQMDHAILIIVLKMFCLCTGIQDFTGCFSWET